MAYKLFQDIQLQDIWSVSYKKGDYHTPHDHGSVGLAGILYLNMPKDAAVTQYIQPWNDWYTDRTIYYPIKVNEGDILAIFDVGAYGFSMSSNYNSRLKPSEVLVSDGQAKLIRNRESIEMLINNENIF